MVQVKSCQSPALNNFRSIFLELPQVTSLSRGINLCSHSVSKAIWLYLKSYCNIFGNNSFTAVSHFLPVVWPPGKDRYCGQCLHASYFNH